MNQQSPPSSRQFEAHAGGPAQGSTTSVPGRFANGRWYFYVTVFTAGFLAALPFWHAARRLDRPSVRRQAWIFTAAGAFLVGLMALTPEANPDGSSGNSTVSTIGGMAVVTVVVIACYQLVGLRRGSTGASVTASRRRPPTSSPAPSPPGSVARTRVDCTSRTPPWRGSSGSDAPIWRVATTTAVWWI
ncbi:hypothetical protein [Blastococcus brunescens]|uniref:Uncharacterized protein n=1 Tax=Blastococcus brunescens TaxID=1564165 RepID=A0ABZ1AXS8_9ACTN|nr:hypothetical protein [Blastococcus sp. BMG 8361]WRL62213.1 hypothetical protein U6N30_19480 [Blastococcus sp. BMG 8361]